MRAFQNSAASQLAKHLFSPPLTVKVFFCSLGLSFSLSQAGYDIIANAVGGKHA